MTTIIYNADNNEIGIDKRITENNRIATDNAKKWVVADDGAIWFYSGCPIDTPKAMAIFDDIKTPQRIKSGKDSISFGAIVAHNKKVYLCYSTSDEYCVEPASFSEGFGSGGLSALCAIKLGKTTIESIEFAKTVDCHTGGDVVIFNVNKMTFK